MITSKIQTKRQKSEWVKESPYATWNPLFCPQAENLNIKGWVAEIENLGWMGEGWRERRFERWIPKPKNWMSNIVRLAGLLSNCHSGTYFSEYPTGIANLHQDTGKVSSSMIQSLSVWWANKIQSFATQWVSLDVFLVFTVNVVRQQCE